MKASNVLKLQTWVLRKRQWITLEQPNRKQIADQATSDLGFKVSTASLRDVLLACEIPTRRIGKHAGEIQALTEQWQSVMAILIKVVSACPLPEWLVKELIVSDAPEAVKAAIRKDQVVA